MREAIGDESVFLRVAEFKNGLIQFTDSTNAMRLIDERSEAATVLARSWLSE